MTIAVSQIESVVDRYLMSGQAQVFRRTAMQRDHRILLPMLFPQTFTAGFAPHHDRFWEWALALQAKTPARSFVALWPRGGGKSSSIEAANVIFAGKGSRSHVLYVSSTQDKADKHLASIKTKLSSSLVQDIYPGIGEPSLTIIGSHKGWRHNFLQTASGYVAHALGLDVEVEGAKTDEDIRPDLICFDDVDHLDDSAATVKKKLEIIKQAIILTRSPHCVVLFVQNLIHPDSIASQLSDGRADFLSDAIIDGPYAALEDATYDERMEEDERGIMRHRAYITGGTPIWAGQGIAECQATINDAGLDAFKRQSQQEINLAREGALFSMFEEKYSVITWTEFQQLYGRAATDSKGQPRIPAVGYLGNYQDVGGTIGHPNGNAWLWRPEQGMPLSDSVFMYRELLLPEYPEPVTKDPSLLTVATMIHRLEEPWQEGAGGRMTRQISHEANTEARFYLIDLPKVRDEVTGLMMKPLRYMQWNPQKTGGVGTLQSYMKVLEREHASDCPHRDSKNVVCSEWMHVEGCPHRAATLTGQQRCWARRNPFRPQLWGRARFYLVVDDDQGALEGDHQRQAYNVRGLVRTRAEIPRYDELKTHGGKAKIFDEMCFVAGTLIETEDGPKSIENMEAGERVWTRAGLRKVLDSRLTAYASPCYKLRTRNGLELIGTGNHPVWTPRGFVRMDELRKGESLVCLELRGRKIQSPVSQEKRRRSVANSGHIKARLSSSTANGFIVTPTGRPPQRSDIFSRINMRVKGAFRHYIRKYGRASTALSRQVLTFTILMKIRSITTSIIWNVFQNPSISLGIWQQCASAAVSQNSWPIWKQSDRWQARGIAAKRVDGGIANTARIYGYTGRQKSLRVDSAVPASHQRPITKSFVAELAGSDIRIIIKAFVRKRAAALVALYGFCRKRITRNTALDNVRSVTILPGKWPVYNLTVADSPEFYANGILVHNCDCLRKAAESFFIPIARQKEEDQIQAAIPEAYRKTAAPELVQSLNELARANYSNIQYVLEAEAKAKVQEQRKGNQLYSHGAVRRGRG